MRSHFSRFLLASLVLTSPLLTVPSASGDADERLLEGAGLSLDGPALLEFFRKRTLADADQSKIKELIRQLGDESFETREKAMASLIALGSGAMPLLRQALQDPDAEIVDRADKCLKQMKAGAGASLAAAAARRLAVLKPPGAAEVLLRFLPFADNDRVTLEVRSAITAAALRDGKLDATLLAALTDKLAVCRVAAAEAICKVGGPQQRPILTKLLDDPEPSVRLAVGLALADLREKKAIPVLIDLLAHLPRAQACRVEELLFRLAGDQAPTVSLGRDAPTRAKCRQAWAEWWSKNGDRSDMARLTEVPRLLGYTLVIVLEQQGESPGKVLELGTDGKPRWQITGLQFPLDAQMLPDERVLITENTGGRVTERDTKGKILWEKKIDGPIMAQRLPNGHTFIATNGQLLEVDRSGKQVFSQQRQGNDVMKALKLRNGEIALASSGGEFIRLDEAGNQLQSFPAHVDIWGGRLDVLPNGHVLVPEHSFGRVVEYDAEGQVAWETAVEMPITAMRVPNGHTLITFMNRNQGVEVDQKGKQVWQYQAEPRVTRLFRR